MSKEAGFRKSLWVPFLDFRKGRSQWYLTARSHDSKGQIDVATQQHMDGQKSANPAEYVPSEMSSLPVVMYGCEARGRINKGILKGIEIQLVGQTDK